MSVSTVMPDLAHRQCYSFQPMSIRAKFASGLISILVVNLAASLYGLHLYKQASIWEAQVRDTSSQIVTTALTAQVHFKSTSREIEEAANIDGAGSWQVFWLITLPLSARGLLAGLVFSWTRALAEFGATILFAGNLQGRTQTMPLLVFSALESNINAALWAGLILIGMAAFALGFTRWLEQAFEDNDVET